MAKVVIIGSAHPFRGGGITTFNHRLANEFLTLGHDTEIFSFSLQYPSFLFPGKSQYTDEAAPPGLIIHSAINSINPVNWIKIGNRLKKLRPDIIVVRFWLPFMGPAFGTILRRVRSNRHTRIVCIADNIKPHEKRPGDIPFTSYFLKACDAFIAMSEKVMAHLRSFESHKPARLVPHPLYDNFGPIVPKTEARDRLGLAQDAAVLLFFGFIRKYKGLDLLLEAMFILKKEMVEISRVPVLIIAGEFYEDEAYYRNLIHQWQLQDVVLLKTAFIPDDEVKYLFGAADAVVQPYRAATQSGVTPLSYHFEKPMLVTDVGGLPAMVQHEKTGLVVKPDARSIAEGILRFYQLGEHHFIPHLRTYKEKFSWTAMVETIIHLANDIQK